MTTSPRSVFAKNWLVIFLIALLAVAYVIAPLLPVSSGWENNTIENAQFAMLLLGGVMVLMPYRHALNDERYRMFLLVVASVWFVMAARELSWGAVFLSPLAVSAETGPVFSSSQLSYRPLVEPVIAVVIAVCLFIFFKTKQALTVSAIWKQSAFPIKEIFVFATAMIISAVAEDHGLIDVSHLGKGTAQVFEELVELCAYTALLCAQARIASSLKRETQISISKPDYLHA